MKDSFFLSRSFVEFGPFPTAELLSFSARGLLQDSDYVRGATSEDWVHVNDWVGSNKPSEPPAPAAKKAVSPTPKSEASAPAPAKKAPAKKAATKKAK